MLKLFDLGRVVATPGALGALRAAGVLPLSLLSRHVVGDWGELCPEDQKANRDAILSGTRLLSVYPLTGGTTIWIMTDPSAAEGHPPVTTLLLPSEY